MLKQLQKRNNQAGQSGFTIIEVMIVLAIAALILLIVLLAVPALQRNSRNTTIKNDTASVAGAISTYESDNNGDVPNSLTSAAGTLTLTNGTTANTAKISGSTTVQTDTTSTFAGDTVGSPTTHGSTATIYAYPQHSCADSGNTVAAASNNSKRSIALYYLIETSGNGNTLQCVSA